MKRIDCDFTLRGTDATLPPFAARHPVQPLGDWIDKCVGDGLPAGRQYLPPTMAAIRYPPFPERAEPGATQLAICTAPSAARIGLR